MLSLGKKYLIYVNFVLSIWILSVNEIPPENMWTSAIGNERRMERKP
jgi:hypothetical protein